MHVQEKIALEKITLARMDTCTTNCMYAIPNSGSPAK
jgi:hypothetical protein